jgi:hypothetical protein
MKQKYTANSKQSIRESKNRLTCIEFVLRQLRTRSYHKIHIYIWNWRYHHPKHHINLSVSGDHKAEKSQRSTSDHFYYQASSSLAFLDVQTCSNLLRTNLQQVTWLYKKQIVETEIISIWVRTSQTKTEVMEQFKNRTWAWKYRLQNLLQCKHW